MAHPSELFRLFIIGHILSPDGKKWNISFCPGVKGSYSCFRYYFNNSWELLKWSWNFDYYRKLIYHAWDFTNYCVRFSTTLLKNIPNDIMEGNKILMHHLVGLLLLSAI